MVATTRESWKSKANENITFRKEKKKKKSPMTATR